MRLFHLLQSHDQTNPTGVPRFSGYFRKAFPDVINITPATINGVEFESDDVVITDNHLSLMVPNDVKTIVVHHGCAPYHYEVDKDWRNRTTEHVATGQRLMFHKQNRFYVAPSKWVYDRFKAFAPPWYEKNAVVIPHWVPENPVDPRDGFARALVHGCPTVIGDWRNNNKGADLWRLIAAEFAKDGNAIFKQLDFVGDEARNKFYRQADIYLCLSLSEGAPYSVADAEAARLKIVSTHVGNCYEFEPSMLMFPDREDVDNVCEAIRQAIREPRENDSYYKTFTFESWQAAWEVVINEMRKR